MPESSSGCILTDARCHGLDRPTFGTFNSLPAFACHLQLLLLRVSVVEHGRKSFSRARIRPRGTTIRWRVSWPDWADSSRIEPHAILASESMRRPLLLAHLLHLHHAAIRSAYHLRQQLGHNGTRASSSSHSGTIAVPRSPQPLRALSRARKLMMQRERFRLSVGAQQNRLHVQARKNTSKP